MALTDNILCAWKCDETSGTTLTDSSPAGNNGTVTDNYFGTGKINNGVMQAINSTGLRRVTSSISTQIQAISRWVKFNYFTSNWVAGAQQSSSDGNGWKCRWINNGSKSTIQLKFGSAGYDTSLVISDNNWHHIVMTKDGSNVKVYLDNGTPYTQAVTRANNGTLTIGTPSYDSSSGLYYNFDEVITRSAGISATDVATLYNGGAGIQYPFSSGPAHIKSINGVAIANIKSINGVPIANIKSRNGVT